MLLINFSTITFEVKIKNNRRLNFTDAYLFTISLIQRVHSPSLAGVSVNVERRVTDATEYPTLCRYYNSIENYKYFPFRSDEEFGRTPVVGRVLPRPNQPVHVRVRAVRSGHTQARDAKSVVALARRDVPELVHGRVGFPSRQRGVRGRPARFQSEYHIYFGYDAIT